MTPASFPESNVVFAKDQPEYLPLPAAVHPQDPQGTTTFCWQLSWRERWMLLWRGKLWHTVLTFKSNLQPQLLSVDKPEFGLVSYAEPDTPEVETE